MKTISPKDQKCHSWRKIEPAEGTGLTLREQQRLLRKAGKLVLLPIVDRETGHFGGWLVASCEHCGREFENDFQFIRSGFVRDDNGIRRQSLYCKKKACRIAQASHESFIDDFLEDCLSRGLTEMYIEAALKRAMTRVIGAKGSRNLERVPYIGHSID